MSIKWRGAPVPLTRRARGRDFLVDARTSSSKRFGIMSESLPRVAYQGEAGAFSEEAVLQCFPDGVEAVAHRDFRSVGEAVISGATDFGVLPVENSLAGSVLAAYDVLANMELTVIAEVTRPIRLCIIGTQDASLDDVRRVISHPVALAQCTQFLLQRPQIEPVAFYDTAGAAKEVAHAKNPSLAAIASRGAAERYGLHVLAEEVQDRSDNQTRFFLVTRRGAPAKPMGDASSEYKTALLVRTGNRPGSLVEFLLPFAKGGVNLMKLESRPDVTPWTYRFVVEISGDVNTEPTGPALEEARRSAESVVVLGSFPCSRF
jgi:prephenate dehydratase